MFFSHFAMQSNYLFQWMKPSLKVMIFFQQIDKAWHQFFGRTRQNCLTPHPLLDHWMHTLTHFVMAISLLSVAASPREYLVRRAAKNVISPPNPPQERTMQKSRVSCKLQEEVDYPGTRYQVLLVTCKTLLIFALLFLGGVLGGLITFLAARLTRYSLGLAATLSTLLLHRACARVRCKRRVDSVAASPREYLVRRAAKNAISPPQKPPQETTMQKSRVSCKLQEEVDSVCQGTVQEKSG